MCIFFSPSRIPSFPPFVKEISGNACNSLPQICHLTRKALSIRKRKIRTRLPLGKLGSDYIGLVPVTGLEPVRCRQRWILSPLRLPFHHTGMVPI